MITVTVNGKTYLASELVRAHETINHGPVVAFSYFSTRNGERFGPIRTASSNDKPSSVGGKIAAQVFEALNADVDTMLSEAVRVTAEKIAEYKANGRTSYSSPSIALITRS